MALPEFRNESPTDFSVEPNRAAMTAALDQVGGDLGKEFPIIIGDERIWRENKFTSWNPSLKTQAVAICQKATAADVSRAVEGAARAFRPWSRVPAAERASGLLRAAG